MRSRLLMIPDVAVIRAEIMGICGTDVKVVSGSVPVALPRTLGHELVGRIVSSPDPRFLPGTRVLVDPTWACRRCGPCRRQLPHLCHRGGLMGREVDGVFTDDTAVDPTRLLVVPDSITARSAGLIQVLGTCVHGLRTAKVFPEDTVIVMGLGVAGQLMVSQLAPTGARVIGVNRSKHKLDLAIRQGATAVATPADAAGLVDEMTGGEGPGLVVEAAGTEATLAHSIELAGTGADIVVFGTTTSGGSGLPYNQLDFKERTLWNPRAALLDDYARAIELVAGGLMIEEIITDMFGLEDLDQALARVQDPASLKVLLTSGGT